MIKLWPNDCWSSRGPTWSLHQWPIWDERLWNFENPTTEGRAPSTVRPFLFAANSVSLVGRRSCNLKPSSCMMLVPKQQTVRFLWSTFRETNISSAFSDRSGQRFHSACHNSPFMKTPLIRDRSPMLHCMTVSLLTSSPIVWKKEYWSCLPENLVSVQALLTLKI